MALPDLSNSLYVARLRYIQSIHESAERRNPDSLVRYFLPIIPRWRAARLGGEELAKLRADPFYYYLLARTKYYDDVFNDSISQGVQRIVSVGCGSDTRPYRFEDLLNRNDVQVLECDQPQLIATRRRIVKRWRGVERVEYLSIDLNDEAWPELERQLVDRAGEKVLVIMEGVSPYINESNFRRFLDLIATRLRAGSQMAYDFKLRGVKEDFGRLGRTQVPFRLPSDRDEVASFHKEHGFLLGSYEQSAELCARLLPDVAASAGHWFREDALVRLKVGKAW